MIKSSSSLYKTYTKQCTICYANVVCNFVNMHYAMSSSSSSPPFGINKAKKLNGHKTKHTIKQRNKPYFINHLKHYLNFVIKNKLKLHYQRHTKHDMIKDHKIAQTST